MAVRSILIMIGSPRSITNSLPLTQVIPPSPCASDTWSKLDNTIQPSKLQEVPNQGAGRIPLFGLASHQNEETILNASAFICAPATLSEAGKP
jgi:hypothetical protein